MSEAGSMSAGNSPPMIDARARTCRCGARFAMRPHWRTGNLAPITSDADLHGNIEILEGGAYRIVPKAERDGKTLFLNHFANCPDAGRFHRRGTDA